MAEAAGIVERDDDGGGGKRTPGGKGCETSEPEPSSDPNPASVSGQHEQGQGEDENAMPNKRPREGKNTEQSLQYYRDCREANSFVFPLLLLFKILLVPFVRIRNSQRGLSFEKCVQEGAEG